MTPELSETSLPGEAAAETKAVVSELEIEARAIILHLQQTLANANAAVAQAAGKIALLEHKLEQKA